MPVRSFTDTSAVSIAYALGDGLTPADFSGKSFKLLPYTSEGFQMQKEARTSTAITTSRRTSGSKNTRGTANGSVGLEFGAAPFILDMLSLALMSEWADLDPAVPATGKFITDSDLKKFMAVEKTTKGGPSATDKLYHERYYGTAVNDMSIEFGDAELVTMSLNTISVFADYASAVAGADGLGGSLATAKVVPAPYEIADSSNNLKSVVLRDGSGTPMEVVFSDASLQVQNNVREQTGLGAEFASGVGVGKVAVTLSGEIYFYDQTVLKAHMDNQRLSAELSVETAQGTFTIYLPNLMAQAPTNNAGGENQDYKTQITFAAEAGQVDLGNGPLDCVIAVKYVAK